MKKFEALYLRDMLDFAYKLRKLTENMSRSDYDANETVQAACHHWLQIIGEAANQIPTTFQDANPQIEWRPMVGMRNRIVHDYLGIDENTVWFTVQKRIPELIMQLELLLSDLPDETNE